MNLLKNLLNKKIVLLDGATGTNLFNKGLEPGEPPVVLNLKNPNVVYELQRLYIDAGSDAILTNTFSANPINFKGERYKDIIYEGVKIAQRAVANKKIVIGDVGPLGVLIKPYGDKNFDSVHKIYKKIFEVFHKAGIKIFLIETFNSIIEAKAAFLAARNFTKNIMVSFSFQENGRTLFGEIPESIAITFDRLGAIAVGVNCTTPEVAIEVIKKMAKVSNLPLIAKPNAGKVRIDGHKITHTISDQELAGYFKAFVKEGANIIGGCCGTTPEYIRRIARMHIAPAKRVIKNGFYLASAKKILKVEKNSLVIVGERLNPSGRKKIREGLQSDNFKIYGQEAKLQEDAGAHCLDVNAFVPGIDEEKALERGICEVIISSSLPVFVDTQNFRAAEKVLKIYPGIGVFNSIPARKKELLRWLPFIKKYGFKAVISLVGKRIPRNVDERLRNFKLALMIAEQIKFPFDDLIFDPLVFSAATDAEQIEHTLKTVATINRMGYRTILGISNVSFGMPQRSILNSVLLTSAIKEGIDFAIVNPLDNFVMGTIKGAEALFYRKTIEYLNFAKSVSMVAKDTNIEKWQRDSLMNMIISGDIQNSVEQTKKLLSERIVPQTIIDDYISPAMKLVGENYEKGKFFIPDLLRAADAAKAVLDLLKKYFTSNTKKGKIVLATVKGDIHDIGKNIAGMVFESVGYEVIDLGKDVAGDVIVKAVKRYKPMAVGLSALLTTTMPEMGNVIKLLRKNKINVPVIIGGPNVNDKFAKMIGAYGAVQNAFDGLKILERIEHAQR
ncbi:MAG: homocysteine S-methyltransferase family protein [bacterium]